MNKFEQLIEYVINDEEAKARELFHDIVVEKSRQIYEEMMEEEAVEEAKEEEELEEAKHDKEEEEVEESKLNEESDEEEVEESVAQEAIGGDQSDDLIADVEAEEQGMSEAEGEEEMADAELEDRVVDLEDKLDELMAEFEALMGGDDGAGEEEMDMDAEVDMDMDTPDMSGEEVVDDELETEGMKMPMEEAVNLKAAPAPVKSEEAGINKRAQLLPTLAQ